METDDGIEGENGVVLVEASGADEEEYEGMEEEVIWESGVNICRRCKDRHRAMGMKDWKEVEWPVCRICRKIANRKPQGPQVGDRSCPCCEDTPLATSCLQDVWNTTTRYLARYGGRAGVSLHEREKIALR